MDGGQGWEESKADKDDCSKGSVLGTTELLPHDQHHSGHAEQPNDDHVRQFRVKLKGR